LEGRPIDSQENLSEQDLEKLRDAKIMIVAGKMSLSLARLLFRTICESF